MQVPSGGIIIWSGTLLNIPNKFVLCDGNNGTPDLRDRFVVGAGDTYAVDDTGGSVTHSHPFTGDGHNHPIAAGFDLEAGTGFNYYTDENSAVGITDAENNLPPYYALCYIMKT